MRAEDKDLPLISVLAKTCLFVRAGVMLSGGNDSLFLTKHWHALLGLCCMQGKVEMWL